MGHEGVCAAAPGRGPAVALAVALTVSVSVSACTPDPNSVAGQAASGDRKGYISGDGTVSQIEPSRRGEPITSAVRSTAPRGRSSRPRARSSSSTSGGQWCPPRVAEMPILQKSWASLSAAGKPVVFVRARRPRLPGDGRVLPHQGAGHLPSLRYDGGSRCSPLRARPDDPGHRGPRRPGPDRRAHPRTGDGGHLGESSTTLSKRAAVTAVALLDGTTVAGGALPLAILACARRGLRLVRLAVRASAGPRLPRLCHRLSDDAGRRCTVLGALLFVAGFTVVFVTGMAAAGAVNELLVEHRTMISRVSGGSSYSSLWSFSGWAPSGRSSRAGDPPRAWPAPAARGGLRGRWTPCTGPTLAAIWALLLTDDGGSTVARGIVLAVAYSIGLGVPFLLVAAGVARFAGANGWLRRHQRGVQRLGGALLLVVGCCCSPVCGTGWWPGCRGRSSATRCRCDRDGLDHANPARSAVGRIRWRPRLGPVGWLRWGGASSPACGLRSSSSCCSRSGPSPARSSRSARSTPDAWRTTSRPTRPSRPGWTGCPSSTSSPRRGSRRSTCCSLSRCSGASCPGSAHWAGCARSRRAPARLDRLSAYAEGESATTDPAEVLDRAEAVLAAPGLPRGAPRPGLAQRRDRLPPGDRQPRLPHRHLRHHYRRCLRIPARLAGMSSSGGLPRSPRRCRPTTRSWPGRSSTPRRSPALPADPGRPPGRLRGEDRQPARSAPGPSRPPSPRSNGWARHP